MLERALAAFVEGRRERVGASRLSALYVDVPPTQPSAGLMGRVVLLVEELRGPDGAA